MSPNEGSGHLDAHLRDQLREAVDALLDDALHERLWIRGQRRSSRELSFDDAILFIIDQLKTDEPHDLVGHILRDDGELGAFTRLSKALDTLVRRIGPGGTYRDAVGLGGPWQEVRLAAEALDDALGT